MECVYENRIIVIFSNKQRYIYFNLQYYLPHLLVFKFVKIAIFTAIILDIKNFNNIFNLF